MERNSTKNIRCQGKKVDGKKKELYRWKKNARVCYPMIVRWQRYDVGEWRKWEGREYGRYIVNMINWTN